MKLSVIVPVLNEEKVLRQTLGQLAAEGHELIVSDGQSHDRTIDIAGRFADRVIVSRPGRSFQQNAGAAVAGGDVLVFVHADTFLPRGFGRHIREALSCPKTVFGAFSLDFYPLTRFLKCIRRTADLRTRVLKTPYGDQGIFIRKSVFYKVGGFAPIPIMEDLDLVRRLKRQGDFCLARGRALTSSRRWEKQGGFLRTVKNQAQILAYFSGVRPQRIARWYGDVR